MTVQADAERGNAFYEDFYKDGGWKYSYWKEFWWHRRHLVKRFNLSRGMRVLEMACGTGFHTNLLNKMGFDCIGVDRSQAGIEWARSHYPRSEYICADMENLEIEPGSFDVVLARGMSHYHYDLTTRQAIHTTATMMRYLKMGGVFVMMIATDLSGKREPDKIWQNTIEDYEKHFSYFDMKYSVDWHNGMSICGLWRTQQTNSVGETAIEHEPAMV